MDETFIGQNNVFFKHYIPVKTNKLGVNSYKSISSVPEEYAFLKKETVFSQWEKGFDQLSID